MSSDLYDMSSASMAEETRGGRKAPSASLLSATRKCGVCNEPATKHFHYGGISCFSCKAFFRRSVQMGADSRYVCNNENRCVMGLKARKKCQRCRYRRCLEAGMKPSWVLTEREKEQRFWKTREKKMRQQTNSFEPHSSTSSSGDRMESFSSDASADVAMVQDEPPTAQSDASIVSTSPVAPTTQIIASPASLVFDSETEIFQMAPDELSEILELTRRQERQYKSLPFGLPLLKEMLMCSMAGIPLSTESAMHAYKIMVGRVARVAHDFGSFSSLSVDAQTTLLRLNTDLVVTLRAAMFFHSSKGGLDQMLASMGVEDVEAGKRMLVTALRNSQELRHIDYKNVNSIQKLDESDESEMRYQYLLKKVGSTIALHPALLKLLSYFVLFVNHGNDLGIDTDRVRQVENRMITMLKRFLLSQFERNRSAEIFLELMQCVPDLRELHEIKKRRSLLTEAVEKPNTSEMPALVAT